MTALLDSDQTKPNNSNVKVAQPLQRNGSNTHVWVSHVINAAIMKECQEAFQNPLPGTRANAAALYLLTSSTPEDWGPAIVSQPSAYHALVWITTKFQGGHNMEINEEWLRQLQTVRMTRDETLDEYVQAKWTLYENLVGNCAPVNRKVLNKAIVDCLPLELAAGSSGLYALCVHRSREEVMEILRSHAYGLNFNDQVPRPAPKGLHVGMSGKPGGSAAEPPKSPKAPPRMRCWECGEYGHVKAKCRKWETAGESTDPTISRPPEPTRRTGDVPYVSLNVLQTLAGCPSCEEWIVDTGATVHVVNDVSILQNPTLYSEPMPLQLATEGGKGGIVASGSVCLLNSEGKPLWLHNVQCVPDATVNLFSVNASERDGVELVTGHKGHYVGIMGPTDWECRVARESGLFVLKGILPTREPLVCQVCVPVCEGTALHVGGGRAHDCNKRRLWHERLGHPGRTASERLSKEPLCSGIPVSLITCKLCDSHCDACVRGKQARPPFPTSTTEPEKVLQRIHADTVGELPSAGSGGEKYFMTVVDELSSFCAAVPVDSKAAIARELISVVCLWQRQTDAKVKVVRTDRGTEFLNRTFHSFCAEEGIHTELSAAYTPQQNGVAERMNRTLKEKARTLLLGVEADEGMWVEAIQTAAYLHNIMPVAGQEKTPFEVFHGKKPHVGHLRKWGCLAYVKLEKHMTTSLGPQSVAGMFVGYDMHSKAYRVRVGTRVLVSRNVHFVEDYPGHTALARGAVSPAPPMPEPHIAATPPEEASSGDSDLDLDTPLPRITLPPTSTSASAGMVPPTAVETVPVIQQNVLESPVDLALPSSLVDQPGVSTELRSIHNSARDPDQISSHRSGVRLRARNSSHLMKSSSHETWHGGIWGRRRHPVAPDVPSRAERLHNRNARKDRMANPPPPEPGSDLVTSGNVGGQGLSEPRDISENVSREDVSGTAERGEAQKERSEPRPEGAPTAETVMDSALAPEASDHVMIEDVSVRAHLCMSTGEEDDGEPSADRRKTQLMHAKSESTCEEKLKGPRDDEKEGVLLMHACERERHAPSQHEESEPHRAEGKGRKQGKKSCKVAFFDERSPRMAQRPEYIPTESEIRSARVVREVMHQQDGAEPSGESSEETASELRGDDEKEYLMACLTNPSLGVRFSKVPVPKNYREAKASEQWEFWEAAMNEEKDSLDAHDCFEYVERPSGHKVIPVHWIYSVKVDEHGNVIRFKARLVAQGCRQVEGVDVDEVFAPTSSFGARRALLCKAAQENLEIHQVDIKTAFLNGELEEEVYVTQPPGFETGGKHVVCRLKKALYGLKQAPRAWHRTLDGVLCKYEFGACKSDAGIYVSKSSSGDPVYLILFVDDMLIMSKSLENVTAFKKAISDEFSIHDLGEVKDFLGCQIVRDREARVIYMSSGLKIDALVEKFGLDGETRAVETPMQKGFVPTREPYDPETKEGSGVLLEPGNRYGELVGSLLYLANTTRPDIAQAVGVLARYKEVATTAHWQEALRVIRYLKGTRDYALKLGGSDIPLEGFVDADFAGDVDMRASTSGFVFKVYGGAVVWSSKKQQATATSTVEAEFRAASQAVKEAIWLRGLLEELHIPVWRVPLHCDNTGCIQNLKNPVNSKYTKHVAVSFHHARTAVILGQVDVKYIGTHDNVADILTKPLVPSVFKIHRITLGIVPGP